MAAHLEPEPRTRIETPGTDFVLTRVFDAPQHVMWRVWTDPDLLARWWGPEGFTNHGCAVELRPGGRWQVTMRGPAGTEFDQDYPVNSTIVELDPPNRLVMAGAGEDYPEDWLEHYNRFLSGDRRETQVETVMEVLLEPLEGGRTRQTIRQSFKSAEARDAILKMGAEQGWEGSFVKLDELFEDRSR